MDELALDLEHRVEAQGEVIMALLAVVASRNREAIVDLQRLFASRHAQRAQVGDYPKTVEHAEEILAYAARIHLGPDSVL